MESQMNSSILTPSDLICSLIYPNNFKIGYDNNKIHEEEVMWLFPHFMKELVKADSSYRMSATKNNTTRKEGTLILC